MATMNTDYFMAIVEAGSLTKAAEKLYISQPSLSQYLKRLEANLGVELFDHGSSPLRLTYVGERYYQYAQQLRKMNEDIRKEFQDIKNELRGRLRLGIALWRGACLLPDIYPQFHEKYPEIQIELFEGRSIQLENALINNNLDVAVMNLPYNFNYAKLTTEIIFEEPILFAAPTKHPVVQDTLSSCTYLGGYPVAPIDIVTQIPLILTKPGQNLTFQIQDFLGKNHLEPKILMETGNLTTAINLTAKGISSAFIPEEGAEICSRPGEVTYFLLDTKELRWNLAAVYRKDSYIPRLARYFIATLKETMKDRVF